MKPQNDAEPQDWTSHTLYWTARREREGGVAAMCQRTLSDEWTSCLDPLFRKHFCPSADVIDFGGGYGRVAPLLKAHGHKYHCVDPCPLQIRAAQERGLVAEVLHPNRLPALRASYGLTVAVFIHLSDVLAKTALQTLRHLVSRKLMLIERVGEPIKDFCYSVPNHVPPPVIRRRLAEYKDLATACRWHFQGATPSGRGDYHCMTLVPAPSELNATGHA